MQREFTAGDLISLPRMKARELLAIARALVLRAHGIHGLERPITEALADVEAQRSALSGEMTPEKKGPAIPLKPADLAEGNAVGALVDFAASWTRLPEADFPEEVATGRACVDLFREDGTLEFLKYKPIVKLSEVQRRIETLAARGLDAKIRELGGGAFLEHLERTHENYGLAVSASTSEGEAESPVIRAQAAALSEAIKTYVIRVVATADRKAPATLTRVNALLTPLRTWTTSASATADTVVEDTPQPAPQPAPQPDLTQRAPANDASPSPVRKVG